MGKMKMSSSDHVIPDDIAKIADDLSVIIGKNFLARKNASTTPQRSGPREIEWEEMVTEILPQDVGEWSWRDVASWFSSECKKRFVPFVIRYERDIGIIKSIHSDLASIGMKNKSDVKEFIEWAFENQDEIIDSEHSFTLTSIRNCVNTYIQKQSVNVGFEKKNLGIDIVEEMKEEYTKNKTVGILRRFGIPLSAAFFIKMKPQFQPEKIAAGMEAKLSGWMSADDLEAIQDVARRSITSSPYPSWFPLLNWRELFDKVWKDSFSMNQKWWKDNDYEGSPYSEYENLKVSE